MAQGKLSQQLQTKTPDERISRTERRKIQFKQIQEKRRFESLKAQAKQIQETKFKDKVVDEIYYEERPKAFTEKHWNSMKSHLREWHLGRAKSRGEEIIKIQRTRQKTIPFTIDNGENSYSGVYESLNEDLKPFFQTPQEVKEAKTGRMETLKTNIQDKFTYADQKITERTKYWNDKIEKRKEWWGNKSSSYRKKEGRKERHKKRLNEYEDDLDEDLAKWQGYKKGLGEAQRKVNQGSELSFSDVENHAYDVGDYYERREEARNENRNLKRKQQRKIDDLISKGYKPMLIQKSFKGKPISSKITFYSAEKKDYADIDLKLKTTDIGKFKQSKIKTAKISQSFVFGGKKFTFETTSKVFKKPSGQLTTVFGALGKSESQILQEQRDQMRKQEQEFDRRASQYLETTGFKSDVSQKVQTKDLTFWQKVKSAYVMTPFGTTVPVPKEYNILREERTTDIGSGFISIKGGTIPKVSLDITKMNTLTWQQSVQAVKGEEKKKMDAEKQIKLIEKLSVITDAAPEDIQYYVQAQGFSQLAKAGVRSLPSKTDPTEIEFSSLDWQPSKSYNLYEWEKSKGAAKVFSGTRIVSTEALKMYGIGKGIGVAVKGVGIVGGKVHQAIGGGLKYTDITMKGGKATATVTVATGKGSTTLKAIGMGAIGLGIGGLYTYSKVKQYQYSKEAFGKAGQEVFFLETGGELLGFGALMKESAVRRADIKKLQKQVQQQTYLKEARASGLKNIQKYGKYHKSAELSYQQTGVGKEVLSKKGIQSLAKEYSKITGITQREATKVIAEKGIYKQVFKVKSSVPSYERALKFIKTGKAPKTTTQYYKTGRYGIFETQRTLKGSSELAFDFKLHGKTPSGIVLKLTQSKGKYAITNVFEKARYSPKDPMKELRLKEIFVTKATKMKTATVGQMKFTQFDIENRLLQFRPQGKTRLTMQEALNIGKVKPSKAILKEYWQRAGSLGKSSSFRNIKVEAPLYRGSKILKIAKEGEYIFAQRGIGKSALPMKTPRLDLLDDALREIKKQQLRSAIKQSRAARGLKGLDLMDDVIKTSKKTPKISEITSDVGKLIQSKLSKVSVDQGLDQTLKGIHISPTIQTSPKIKTAMRLDAIPELKEALSLKIATGQASALRSQTKLKQLLKTKQKVQQDLSLKQIQKLDLGLKQVQQTRQKTKQIQSPVLNVAQVVENLLRTPTIRTPTTATPQAPRIPKIVLPKVAQLKKLLKQKAQKVKSTETLYYLPDFTSRAIGLDPIEITSVKQANKLLKKIHTGLEVRRGVRVKIPN